MGTFTTNHQYNHPYVNRLLNKPTHHKRVSSTSGSEFLHTGSNSSHSSADTMTFPVANSKIPRVLRPKSENISAPPKPPLYQQPKAPYEEVKRLSRLPPSPEKTTERSPGRLPLSPGRYSDSDRSPDRSPYVSALTSPKREEDHDFRDIRQSRSPQRIPPPTHLLPTPNARASTSPSLQRDQKAPIDQKVQKDDESDSEYTSDSDLDSDSSTSTVSVQNTRASHPYESQWRQYYASMAAQQYQRNFWNMPQQQMMPFFPPSNGPPAEDSGHNDQSQAPSMQMMMQWMQWQQFQMQQMMMMMQMQNPQAMQQNPQMMQNMQAMQLQMQQNMQNPQAMHMMQTQTPGMPQQTTRNKVDRAVSAKQSPLLNADNSESLLVLNSRKSLLKSNRYPSVPLSVLQNEQDAELKAKVKSVRSNSLSSSFKPGQKEKEERSEEERGGEVRNNHEDNLELHQTSPPETKAQVEPETLTSKDVPEEIKLQGQPQTFETTPTKLPARPKTQPTNSSSSVAMPRPDRSIPFGLLDLAHDSTDHFSDRQISDYNKYFYSDKEPSVQLSVEQFELPDVSQDETFIQTELQPGLQPGLQPALQSALHTPISSPRPHLSENSPSEKPLPSPQPPVEPAAIRPKRRSMIDEVLRNSPEKQLPQRPQPHARVSSGYVQPEPLTEGLERNESLASANSYNSFQSDSSSKFKVGTGRDHGVFVNVPPSPPLPVKKSRSSRIKEKMKKDKKKRKSRVEEKHTNQNMTNNQNNMMNPNMNQNMNPHNNMPMNSNMNMNPNIPMNPNMMSSPMNTNMNTSMNMMNAPVPADDMSGLNPMYPMMNFDYNPNQKRQSIATADAKRKSMLAPMAAAGNRMSMPPMASGVAVAKSTDSTISKKIDEFVKLRAVIASGNKSLEFRLKWIKMLVTATNYKLYAYVNIKGEPIGMDKVQLNKALFLKSSVTHLLKMVKEFETKSSGSADVYSEVCFVYGCLLKQDFLGSYNQDFDIEKDIPKAVEFFNKSISFNPSNSKAYHRLGEIHEFELQGRMSEAVDYYRRSAKLGYNRAIYKIAMLYLYEPTLRSTKFFTYLIDLSSIDLESKDIQLDDADRDELEEVVGLATYELGKIYEGIYPGDLLPESEFVVKSLEIAPVNYAKSLTYYNKAAKLNCLLSQVKLGTVYEYGELNRQRSPNKSIQWYIKASSSPLPFKRHPDAMLGLCRWCLQGSQGQSKHIPGPNPEKAVMWCERAMKEFETPEAYFAMGELTEQGLGKGNPKAYYMKAYKLGLAEAGTKLEQYRE